MPWQQAVTKRRRKGQEELVQNGKEWGIWIHRPDSLPLYTLTRCLGGTVRGACCPHPPPRVQYPDANRGPRAYQSNYVGQTNPVRQEGEAFHGRRVQTALVTLVCESPQ
jgi:hypothetical protein